MSTEPRSFAEISDWLAAYVASLLGSEPHEIDASRPLVSIGLSSLDGITMASRLGIWLGQEVPASLMWDYPSIDQIARAISGSREPDGASEPGPAQTPDRDASDDPIAIVGLSCRFAGAPDAEAYWSLLARGDEGITEIPPDRWDVDAFHSTDPDRPATIASRWGGFLSDLDQFDAAFFRLTPREANALDPRQRLALEVAWEALEDAGIPACTLAGTPVGVFMATLGSNFGDTLFTHHLRAVDAYSGSGSGNAVVANRLSHAFDLQGPSVAVDTACSGSLVALHLACKAIREGECETALAGGVNVILRPDDSVFFSKTGALAADGRCKPFDARADGIVRSEGAGIVVLKRLSDALRDRDRVYAVIAGSAVNHSGATNGIMAPSSAAQAALLRKACHAAGVAPGAVQYVEAHGTGTAVGDPIELNTLGEVLGETRAGQTKLRVGSVKGNIGHAEAAAGIAGLIKTVLSIHHRQLPATRNFETPNPLIHFDRHPVAVQNALGPWPDPEQTLLAGVSSFGFAGTNAHALVAEAPGASRRQAMPVIKAGPVLITISARSEGALRDLAKAYAAMLVKDQDLPGLAAALALHRDPLDMRCAIFAETADEARDMLLAIASDGPGRASAWVERPLQTPRTVFVFSGQGSHWIGMGLELIDREPLFKRVIEQCDQFLHPLAGWSLLDELRAIDGASRLDRTEVMQPAIFAIQVGLSALLQRWGLVPDAVVGQSLGEVAAAHVSGALGLEDAVKVVFHRSRLMAQTAGSGATAVVGLAPDWVAQFLDRDVEIAGQSGPGSCVLAGPSARIDDMVTELEAKGIFARRISNGGVAFHSAQMDPLLPELEASLSGIELREPRVPVYTALAGGRAEPDAFGPDYWVRNLRHPFRLPDALAAVARDGPVLLAELSPSPVLLGPLGECLGGAPAPVVPTLKAKRSAHRCLLETLGLVHAWGGRIDWRALYPGGAAHLALPKMPWQRKRYWFDQLPNATVPSGFDDRTGRPWVGSLNKAGHPLLGVSAELAGRPGERLWSHSISSGSVDWLADHRVGTDILLPAAAFVEMTLASCRELGCEPVVENLEIERALKIPDDEPVQMQATARPGADGTLAWEVFSLGEEGWRRHARATLGATGTQDWPLLDLGTRGRPIADHYRVLAADGLSYGPAFQGVGSVWSSDDEVLARLDLPTGLIAEDYLGHPALIDAGVQAARHLSPADHPVVPRLPVGMRTCLIDPERSSNISWCRVSATGPAGPEETLLADLAFADEAGGVCMILAGLQLAPVGRTEAMRSETAWLGRDWILKPHGPPGASARLPGPSTGAFRAELREKITSWCREQNAEHHARIWPWLDRLVVAYTISALRDLGWAAEAGPPTPIETLGHSLGILPARLPLLERLLGFLAEEGCALQSNDTWAPTGLDMVETPESLLQNMLCDVPSAGIEASLVQRAGEALADVLTGRRDPIDVLFGGDGDALLLQFYQDAPILRVYNAALAEIVAAAAGADLTRIVEVGAGTGAATSHLLDRLPADGVEYVLTDLSARLVDQTALRFADDPRVSARVLDLERDPAHQGFQPGRQDVVVAANVLHATADLRQTLAHVRGLLAPGGALVMLEGNGPQRWLDLLFGATDGWWLFRDRDRARSNHPLLKAEEWGDLLRSEGFEQIDIYTDDTDTPSQLVAVARTPQPEAPRRRWLIIGGDHVASTTNDLLEARQQRVRTAGGDGEDMSALLDTSDGIELEILFARGLTLPSGVPDKTGLSALDRELANFLSLVRDLGRSPSGGRRRLWMLTRGAQPAGEESRELAPSQAALAGMARSLFLEQPDMAGAVIDLDPDDPDLGAVLREIEDPDGEEQIANRGGQRHVARLVRRERPDAGAMIIRPEDTWLITGGLSGIGLATARWLAGLGVRRLVLVARSDLPPRRTWSDPDLSAAVRERIDAVRELEARGAAVRVIAADVGDPQALRQAILCLEDEGWPEIRGAVHSAGLIEDRLLVDMDPETLLRVAGPKIRGAATLHQVLPGLRYLVLFSSAASLVGGTLGQANYVAGNAFLDALAHHRKALGLSATTINWGIWGGSGIVARSGMTEQLARTGLLPIPADVGIDALSRIVTSGIPQAGLAVADWARWRNAFPALAGHPYYQEMFVERDAVPTSTTSVALDLAALSPAERARSLEEHVAELVGRIIQQEVSGPDRDQPLSQLGLDSIMAVELKHHLEGTLGSAPPIVDLLRGASVRSIAQATDMPADAAQGRTNDLIPRIGGRVRRASSLQEVFWSVEQRAPDCPVYSLPFACWLSQRIEPDRLTSAIERLAARHAALRTALILVDGRLCQSVEDEVRTPDVVLVDLEGLDHRETHKALRSELDRWARLPIALDQAPMMRCAVFQANGRSVCLFALHHAIVDGWSAGVFVRELDALVSDAQPIDPDTDETDAPEYADYVEWQSERLESGALDEQLAFWSAQMSEPPGPLFDAPLAPATKRGFPGRQQPVALEPGTVAGLDRLSQRTGVTLSTVLLTGYYATLATVFEREDLCIGLARSNRDRRELRDLLGCFVNTLPVRATARSETPFSELLAEVNEAVINAVSNCDVPLDAIARAAMPARATLALQAAFVFKTTPAWLPEIVEKIEQLCSGTSKIELGLDLTRDGEHVAGFFEYDTGRLSRVEAEELAEMYRALMAAAASDPDAALADLSEKAMRTECRTRELERL